MRWRDFASLPVLPDDFFDERSEDNRVTRRVHFIGVGGIGMSALAFALADHGHTVSGSDAHDSPLLQKLREAGVQTYIGHRGENILQNGQAVDAIIWGSAIVPDNPERLAATTHKIPQWHRAQLLAYFVNRAAFSIAVSGTHGKSTTSAMIAHILTKLGHNPTALLGAEYPPFHSNVRLGDPDLVVVEADESDGSFTLCRPTVAVVTNVEAEHLENYDDSEEELWRAFKQFVGQAKHRILNANDARMTEQLNNAQALHFGIRTSAALEASNIFPHAGEIRYDLFGPAAGDHSGPFRLLVPGQHNLSNALAAILAATTNKVAAGDAAESLADFHGVKRRFQLVGEANGVVVYDDYGHHPTEVQSTLEAAREFLQRPIIVIFQPHRFSRTQQMGHLFGPSFEAADKIIITELYSAFETPIEGISGRIVYDAVRESWPHKTIAFAPNLDEARRIALEWGKSGDAIITMGAGDIGTQPKVLCEELSAR